MSNEKIRYVKLWVAVGLAVIFVTIGAGFYHNSFATSDETYKGLKLFSDVIELIEKNYVEPVQTRKLIDDAIQGMVHGLDPHSALLSPEEYRELQMDTQGEFTGIGISITMRNGLITVVSAIEGTPAYRAGIKPGDVIISIAGKNVRDLKEAVSRIRGPKGSKVSLTLMRGGVAAPLTFNLVRDTIPIESVKFQLLEPGYGYVWITNFRENTTQDLIAALDKMKAKTPLKGIILDLRNNPGGLLNQAIEVCDLFIEKGPIVSIKGRDGRNTKVFKAHPGPNKRRYPIVVLINGGSASASEIVAGALQDQKRALIMGTTSFGKGSVQNVEPLRNGYALKLTIARYYTPSGRSIQAKGIEPDIVVPFETGVVKENNKETTARMPKEKDLENHLAAEPNKGKINTSGIQERIPESLESETINGPLNKDTLKNDNQVKRALETLISYDIFKRLEN